MTPQRDIFICHASEDKAEVVRPLIISFKESGITYWYDEAEIKWGNSITEKVNEGLKISRYVIVVLSESFMQKKWPQRELNAALNIEASSGNVRVLPLIAGSTETKNQIIETYPILNDKSNLTWNNDTNAIIIALVSRLEKTNTFENITEPKRKDTEYEIPLPKIQKKYTQMEKDKFLKSTFPILQDYFQKALSSLQDQYKDIATDYTEIHNYKFICTVYLHGDISNKCKIWIGGLYSEDTIAYYDGTFDFDNDSPKSDWLSVCDDETDLGLKASGMSWSMQGNNKDNSLSPEKASEYLWLRFTENLKKN
jgi:hypothetical protein